MRRSVLACMAALLLGIGGAGNALAEPDREPSDSPWALVPEEDQRMECDGIAAVLEAGGGGPLQRLDTTDDEQGTEGAWQCYWDSPTGVYFYAEFDVDLVSPEQQLAAGLRDFRAEVERD